MVLQIILADILLVARIFPRPCGARKNNTQLVKYPRVLSVNHRIRCMYCIPLHCIALHCIVLYCITYMCIFSTEVLYILIELEFEEPGAQPLEEGENQKKTQPTYDTGSGIRTRGTLQGNERSDTLLFFS